MKNKFLSFPKRGLSLTELLLTVILISIVMLGVISFSFAITQIKVTTDKSTILTMETAAVMKQFRKDALQAIGYKRDPGIIVGAGDEVNATPTEWIAFRQDRNQTPDDYSDDIWVIFAQFAGTNEIIRCEQQSKTQGGAGPVPNIVSDGECSSAKREVISNNMLHSTFSVIANTDGLLKFYINAYFQSQYNPLQPPDPIKNPQYTLETKIFPSKHSW